MLSSTNGTLRLMHTCILRRETYGFTMTLDKAVLKRVSAYHCCHSTTSPARYIMLIHVVKMTYTQIFNVQSMQML